MPTDSQMPDLSELAEFFDLPSTASADRILAKAKRHIHAMSSEITTLRLEKAAAYAAGRSAGLEEEMQALRDLYELALAAPKQGWDKWRNATDAAAAILKRKEKQ